jgi:hypothetical protein
MKNDGSGRDGAGDRQRRRADRALGCHMDLGQPDGIEPPALGGVASGLGWRVRAPEFRSAALLASCAWTREPVSEAIFPASWGKYREFCSARPPGPANGARFSGRFKYL